MNRASLKQGTCVLGGSKVRKKTGLASMMKVRGKFWFLLLWLLRRRNIHDDFIPEHYSLHLHTLVIFLPPLFCRLFSLLRFLLSSLLAISVSTAQLT
jgi:hypothetical protein